ncbi:MAG: CpXC domain-containing protein [Kiritimatiellales bacterium]|nr:CpXC domain-containing protein [Kiritimatiellales bacterium]
MSAQKTYNIRCPQCGHQQKVELYDSINVTQQPELKTALFENRLNCVLCGSCESAFRIDKPLLYHDPGRNILIHWMPDTAVSREEILDEFDKSMEELRAVLPEDVEPPRVRLVFTRTELVELIFVIEAGMEERVVEYIKYTIHMQNQGRVPPKTKQLLLNVQDSTADELLFAVQNAETFELEEVLRYPRTAYRSMREMYRKDPDELSELFPGPYISARSALMAENPVDEE